MNIFKKIFSTDGRLNRKKFLIYYVALTIMGASSKFVTSCMATLLTGDPNGKLVMAITVILAIAATVGACMLMVRRLHDLGKRGEFFLVSFIPFVGLIFLVYLFCAEGQVGWNKYGADPLDEDYRNHALD